MLKVDIIYNKDCLEGMKELPDKCIDAVIADMPYGVLNRKNGSAGWEGRFYRRIRREARLPHHPLCAGHFLGATHALATPDVAV